MIEKMLSDIRVSDSAAEAVIDIVGVIGVPEQAQFDQAGERVATYARFADALTAVAAVQAPRVVVNIRSTGGDVNDALLIFDALRGLGAQVVTRCYGYVASAATVIAQAASPGCREISSNALYLIHCSESAAEGNARSLSQAKELLDRTDERIAAIYASRSGLPASGFAALMNENGGKGRWLTPDETIAAGLADRIVPSPADNSVDERSCGGGDIGALCRLFGMTLPPDAAGEERRESFAERFMYFFGGLGTLMFLFGGAAVVAIIAQKLYRQSHNLVFRAVTDQPLFHLCLLAVALGVMLFLAGFLGELINRTSADRNRYLIDEEL